MKKCFLLRAVRTGHHQEFKYSSTAPNVQKKINSRKAAKRQRIPLCAFARIKKNSFAAADRLQRRQDAKVLPSVGRPACRKKIYQSAGFFCE